MKIAHLCHLGPRSHNIITQGLLDLKYNFDIDKDYFFNKKLYKQKKLSIIEELQDYDIIFAGDTVYKKIFEYLNLWEKIIWYDFEDQPILNLDFIKSRLYFKRNIYDKDRRIVLNNYVLPLDYCAMHEFFLKKEYEKIYDISCFFDLTGDSRRDNLVKTLSDFGVSCYATAKGSYGRNSLEKSNCFEYDEYLKKMKQSKIIFTAFPQNHDGDSRTWEAFSSGAIVFRDKTFIKHKMPLIDKEHFFEYDAKNIDSIKKSYYLAKDILKNYKNMTYIAENGFNHVRNYHMAKNRVSYMLSYFLCTLK